MRSKIAVLAVIVGLFGVFGTQTAMAEPDAEIQGQSVTTCPANYGLDRTATNPDGGFNVYFRAVTTCRGSIPVFISGNFSITGHQNCFRSSSGSMVHTIISNCFLPSAGPYELRYFTILSGPPGTFWVVVPSQCTRSQAQPHVLTCDRSKIAIVPI